MSWKILVVDDEEDVHQVTRLALRRKAWRSRPFELHSAMSAAEARSLLTSGQAPEFQVALVDVVMETPTAGLELCSLLRQNCTNSLRIVLRTGQPGVAPEEYVLNEYDIDFYLAKPEVTADRLYAVLRSCLRSSQDISTLLAFSRQIQSFTRSLQTLSSIDDLLVFMSEGLKFLELKHSVRLVFVHDIDGEEDDDLLGGRSHSAGIALSTEDALRALIAAHSHGLELQVLHEASNFGLPLNTFVLPFTVNVAGDASTAETTIRGGVCVELTSQVKSAKFVTDFMADANLFLENWRIAYAALLLKEQAARDRLLREKMYLERAESIAKLVTGVAHEINTPLGVANTANSMIQTLAQELAQGGSDLDTSALTEDLTSSCRLLTKNLARAHKLIQSFKKLSVSQLSDERMSGDLREIVRDCIETMSPELTRQNVEVSLEASDDAGPWTWDGFPGHLSQVIVNLLQNAMKHAYPNGVGGKVVVTLRNNGNVPPDTYRIEVADHGVGIPRRLRATIFEPFVSSAMGSGGSGLGLAITYNIVTKLLGGTVSLRSGVDEGTTFTVDLPRVVKEVQSQEEAILAV